MAELTVRLFGGFEVHRSAGPSIRFPTRKARALFALLARHPGQHRPREGLAAMLWPDSAEPESRGSLRQALKLLRRALPEHGDAAIISEGDALMLQSGAAEVDVEAFERLHATGTPQALKRAAVLYRGDFLAGLTLADGPFADWSISEQMHLRERALDVFSRLLDIHQENRETEPAIETALRLLDLDPLQEHVHRCLMQLHCDQGRRGSALEQYRVCCITLERELGVRPEDETEQLYREISSRRTQVAAAPRPNGAESRLMALSRSDALFARPAVAVLPFADLGGDPEQGYFADGLSEDIITGLAGWRFFPLIASTSAFGFRGRNRDLRKIAAELGARYLVDGTLRRSGRTLRISAQLIDAETSHCLWARRFDFDMRDALAVQTEAADMIAAAVEPELERAELHRIVTKRTDDLDAWDHFLRGWSLVNRFTHDDCARARSQFEQALRLDPKYSDALMGLANGYLRDLLQTGTVAVNERDKMLVQGVEAARQAVTFDPNSSAAHVALGQAHVWSGEFEAAIAETDLAVDLNPSNAHARMALGNRLDLSGRALEGIAQMEHSLRLNPRDPRRFIYLGYLARAQVALGQYEAALQSARKAAEVRPDVADVHFRLAICLAHLDRADEARVALEQCERLQPGFLESRKDWKPYSDAARNEHFFEGLRRHKLWS